MEENKPPYTKPQHKEKKKNKTKPQKTNLKRLVESPFSLAVLMHTIYLLKRKNLHIIQHHHSKKKEIKKLHKQRKSSKKGKKKKIPTTMKDSTVRKFNRFSHAGIEWVLDRQSKVGNYSRPHVLLSRNFSITIYNSTIPPHPLDLAHESETSRCLPLHPSQSDIHRQSE